jgi:hypothetical protein
MRVLGILIVVLAVATFLLILFMRKVVAPYLQRRNIDRIERDNARLDKVIGSDRPYRSRHRQ